MIRPGRCCSRQKEQLVQMSQSGNQFGKSEEHKSNPCAENIVEKGRGEWCEVNSEGKQGSYYTKA